jgi:hypothetical protein
MAWIGLCLKRKNPIAQITKSRGYLCHRFVAVHAQPTRNRISVMLVE